MDWRKFFLGDQTWAQKKAEFLRPMTYIEEGYFVESVFFFVLNLSFFLVWFYPHREDIDLFYRGELIPLYFFLIFFFVSLLLTNILPIFAPYCKTTSLVTFWSFNFAVFLFLLYIVIVYNETDDFVIVDLDLVAVKRSVLTLEKLSVLFDNELSKLDLTPSLKERMISLKPTILQGVETVQEFEDRFYLYLRRLKYGGGRF